LSPWVVSHAATHSAEDIYDYVTLLPKATVYALRDVQWRPSQSDKSAGLRETKMNRTNRKALTALIDTACPQAAN